MYGYSLIAQNSLYYFFRTLIVRLILNFGAEDLDCSPLNIVVLNSYPKDKLWIKIKKPLLQINV